MQADKRDSWAVFLVSRDWKHDLKNEAATRAWLHNLKVPPNYPVCMLADVHTVFSLRDYAVHGIVGVNLRCSLVISTVKLYQSSYTATSLGARLQHTTIVPFAPDRLQHQAWNTVVIINTTDLTFIVRPFSIRNISHFPPTRAIYVFREILTTFEIISLNSNHQLYRRCSVLCEAAT